jgi:hypothetical protein
MMAMPVLPRMFAVILLIACTGCTAQILAADDPATLPDSFSSSPPTPPPVAIDATNGHVLISVGPGIYMDPSDNSIVPQGLTVPNN